MSDCILLHTGDPNHGNTLCDECGQVPQGNIHYTGSQLKRLLSANPRLPVCIPTAHQFCPPEGKCVFCLKTEDEIALMALQSLTRHGEIDLIETLPAIQAALQLSEFPGGRRCPDPNCDMRREDGHATTCSIKTAFLLLDQLTKRCTLMIAAEEGSLLGRLHS